MIEAQLRNGCRHAYGKRRCYLDEDSWQILAVDRYGKHGELTGLQASHPINYSEVPLFAGTLETVYDFNARLDPRDFTPQALRRDGN